MEMQLENYICPTEDVTTPSEKSGDQSLKQCFRKGDVIYYAKPENIHMYQKNGSTQKTDGTGTRPSLESDGQTDTVNSGESLFKVFTFEQSSNDEDTEKCIAFWKSVMEKNLTPIKCTIIENTKKNIPPPQEKPKSLEEEEGGSHATDENIAEKIHEEYRDMWVSALREIQRKKLHEIKLTNKARCSMCDSISSSVEQFGDKVDKRQIKKEIKELNDWKSVSTKKQRQTSNKADAKIKASSTNSSLISPSKKGETTKPSTQKSKDSIKKKSDFAKGNSEKINTENSSVSLKEKIIRSLVPDTNTYIYKDVIGEKKKNGVYSKWRSNAVEEVCQCKNSTCDCNINPAIVAIERNETSTTPCTENSFVECKKTELSSNSYTEQDKEQREVEGVRSDCNEDDAKQLKSQSNKAETFKDERFTDLKDLRTLFSDQNDLLEAESSLRSCNDYYKPSILVHSHAKVHKSISMMLKDCHCSNEDCDCFHIEHAQKEPSLTGWDPCNLPARAEFKKLDSLEIFKRNKGVESERPSVQVLYPPSTFDENNSIFDK